MQNQTYEFYTTPYNNNSLTFEWPKKILNEQKMDLVHNEGSIIDPIEFTSEEILCQIEWLTVNKTNLNESVVEDVYKCLPSKEWLIYLLTVGLILQTLLIFSIKHGSIKTILGPKFSGIIRWIEVVLCKKETSINDSEGSWTISEISKSLHTPVHNGTSS